MVTILIADDDDKLRQMVRRLLERQGHRVIEATNGEAALKAFKTTIPDLAILDVNMGEGLNGFEVCKKIREDPYGISIPIIFLTGLSDEEDLLKGFQHGADDYIRKPFSIPEFQARVQAQIERIKRQTLKISQLGDSQFKLNSEIQGEKDRYIITSRLTSGGMGVIFRGYRLSDGLQVVIKTLNSKFLDNYKDIRRFLREANAAIKLKHPNLAEGLEVVRTPNHCFYVMKYVKGKSLAEILDREGFLDQKRALNIIKQIARGLDHFHKNSLVHRDVKPGNILVDENDHAVLVDMGLAKAENSQSDLTTEGVILGTPYYLSPEQALGEKLDIRSDIYSLGATFYHTVTGVVPFRGASTIAIINARFIGNPEPPKERVPEVSEEISKIILKMMARDPNDRYQSPKELLEVLENVKL